MHFRYILLLFSKRHELISSTHEAVCCVWKWSFKKGYVKIGLQNFLLVIFDWKMCKNLATHLKLMRDETHFKVIIDSDHHSTTHEITEELNVLHMFVEKNLNIFAMSRNSMYGSLISLASAIHIWNTMKLIHF